MRSKSHAFAERSQILAILIDRSQKHCSIHQKICYRGGNRGDSARNESQNKTENAWEKEYGIAPHEATHTV